MRRMFIVNFSSIPVRSLITLLLVLASPVQAAYMSTNSEENLQLSTASSYQQVANPHYQFKLGIAAFESANYGSAVNIFTELAKAGHMNAQFYLAIMLDSGSGIEEDHMQAALWYSKAASKGHVEAQYNLSMAYASGEGVDQDMQKSIYWMKKAALNGSVNSQYNLGLIYMFGDGVEANMDEGILWWKLAAKNGDATAQFNLGMIYLEGRGVESDICEATRWWQISADNGHSNSRIALQTLKETQAADGCIGMVSSR